MKLQHLSFREAGAFSELFLDYTDRKPDLKKFYGEFPDEEGILKAARARLFPGQNREVLHKVLKEQYQNIEVTEQVLQNLDALQQDNTFTVTTGHQVNIFTGPLYFIYKIVTVIKACKSLNAVDKDRNYVPVYWMASEDHDFEEISYFNLFGKKYQWETEQRGAVGRFDPKELKAILDELPEDAPIFREAYLNSATLAEAVRKYVNALFGKYGLVVIDPDHADLKKLFTDVIRKDVLGNSIQSLVEEQTSALESLGYKSQLYPREINFFYLKDDIRERIELSGDTYQVLNTDISFSRKEMEDLISGNPEVFSPNVVLRPLYQETILPNLAYVGGPSEGTYWLQLKKVFEETGVQFPVLLPRNFALVVSSANNRKLEKTGLKACEFFSATHELKETYLQQASDNDLSLNNERKSIQKIFEELKDKAADIDGSLEGFIGAEGNKVLQQLGNIEKRLKKSEERKHETALSQITALKEKLFPNGSLQERHDNFLNFYLNDREFIDKVLEGFDPFDLRFHIFIDGQ